MKRSFAFFALVCAILFGCTATAGAQSKALKKDVKKRVKELTKEGWKPLASSSTLEYAFSKYRTYLEEDPENRIELVGIAIGKNVKIGRENAIMNGITSYASRAKAQVVGKMKGLMSSEASSTPEEEIDKFGAAYESGVNTKIAGLVKQHLVLVKETRTAARNSMYICLSMRPKQRKLGKRLRWRLKNRWLWAYSPSKWRSLSANR